MVLPYEVRRCPRGLFPFFDSDIVLISPSFDIAKSTEDSRYFIVAANIAERSDELYCEQSPLKQRCQQCLLAAVSSDMKKFEILEKSQLLELLEVIDRLGSIDVADTSVADDVMSYLV